MIGRLDQPVEAPVMIVWNQALKTVHGYLTMFVESTGLISKLPVITRDSIDPGFINFSENPFH